MQIYDRSSNTRYSYRTGGSRERRRRRKKNRQVVFFSILAVILGVLLVFIFGKLISEDSGKKPDHESEAGLTENDERTESTENTEKHGDERPLVVVDPGHGGKDPGTANGEILEKDICLDLAFCLKAELEKLGIRVILTREDDSFLYLRERSDIANNENADLFISLHVDSYYDDVSVRGMTCHYGLEASNGMQLALTLAAALREEDDLKIRDTKESDLFVLNNTNMPAVLLEVGFISSQQDLDCLTSPDFQKRLAGKIADTLAEYLEPSGLVPADFSQNGPR